MRVLLLLALVASFAVVAYAQAPVAPVIKRDNLAGDITSCPIGQGLATNQKPYRCAPCLAGYYKNDATLTGCLPCQVNAWSPQGSNTCYWCPGGTSTEAHGASAACTECPYGQVLNYAWAGGNEALRCTACGVNTYQPLAGQISCATCPGGMTTQGATGAGECFAVGGGNTIANVAAGGAPGVGAAKSLLQVLSKRLVASKPATKGVAPSTAAPHAPQIVKRSSYKGRANPAAKGTRSTVEAAAAANAKAAKASKKH